MKRNIAIVCILILLVSIFICGCSTKDKSKNQEHTVESLLQNYNSNLEVLKEYEGQYFFQEEVSPSESGSKYTLFHGVMIKIYFEENICYADVDVSYGNSSHDYKALVTESKEGISLLFMETLWFDDRPRSQDSVQTYPKLDTYKVGDELLRIVKNGEKYEAYWGELQPVRDENKNRTDCFERPVFPDNTASDETKAKILKLVDNETPASELITKTINTGLPPSLKDFFEPTYTVPQCVRYSNGNIYTINKSVFGYSIGFYGNLDTSEYKLCGWLLSRKTYLKDYEKLYEERAPYDKVYKQVGGGNAHGSWESSSTKYPCTTHYTVDGYKVEFEYEPRGDFKIRTMNVYSGEENEIYYNLLPIDLELLK